MQQRSPVLKGRRGGRPQTVALLIPLLPLLLLSACSSESGIEGTVSYAGAGLAGVYVEAYGEPPSAGSEALGAVNSDPGGGFLIPLPPGSYYLTARRQPRGGGSAGMLFASSGEEPLSVGRGMTKAAPLELADRSGQGPLPGGGTAVRGRVLTGDVPVAGAYVYLYRGDTLRGPDYLLRLRTGGDGTFALQAPPGLYSLTVRVKGGGDAMGAVREGDLVGEYAANPFPLGEDPLDTGDIPLHGALPGLVEEEAAPRALRGRIVDGEGRPVPGIYALLYRDHRMVGKPGAISAPSADDGSFTLLPPGAGVYYLGARSTFGGPVEPGELSGVYEQEGERALCLGSGAQPPGLEIVVREVW